MCEPLGYFYDEESELFTFFRVPKALYTDEQYKSLTSDEKLLYGLMLDRMELSKKNKWFDKDGRVYIIFTLEEIQELMNCGHDKAGKMLANLDIKKGVGLIKRVKQGLGKPDLIYVLKFINSTDVKTSEKPKSRAPEKPKSRTRQNRSQDVGKSAGNNTDANYNEGSNIDSSDTDDSNTDTANIKNVDAALYLVNQSINRRDAIEENEYKKYEDIVKKNIDYDHLVRTHSATSIDGIVSIMVNCLCSKCDYLRVNRSDFSADIVKSRLLKLNANHIEYALESINNNTTKISDILSYKLTTLYNAPDTIDAYYTSRVNHDLYRENQEERYAQ